jgi:hypothetical protein
VLTIANSCSEDALEADDPELIEILGKARERWLQLCTEAAEDDDTSRLELIPEEINRFFQATVI